MKNLASLYLSLALVMGSAGTSWGDDISTEGAQAGSIVVALNKAEVVRTKLEAFVVQIGNPKIADVNMPTTKTVIVLGIAPGETNLLLLDKDGQTIKDLNVIVVDSDDDGDHNITVHQGSSNVTSLHCAPTCSTTDPTGDDKGSQSTPSLSP